METWELSGYEGGLNGLFTCEREFSFNFTREFQWYYFYHEASKRIKGREDNKREELRYSFWNTVPSRKDLVEARS